MFPIHTLARVYVDQTNGNDSNPGTATRPVSSITTAITRLARGGSVFIHAPESDPYEGQATWVANANIDLRPWGDAKWHMRGTQSTGLYTYGPGRVRVFGADVRGHIRAITLGSSTVNGGKMECYDTYAEGTESGFRTIGRFETFVADRCTGKGLSNDGFNIHGDSGYFGVATLTDCIGNDCGDEGVSPHVDTTLHLIRGEFCRNGQAGMAAVQNAVITIDGTKFEGNGLTNNTFGGVYFGDNTSGSFTNMETLNNVGPGIWLDTTGAVTVGSYVSTGNGKPDDLG